MRTFPDTFSRDFGAIEKKIFTHHVCFKWRFAALVIVAFLLFGCAKVGEPLPPRVSTITGPTDLQLIQAGEQSIELIISLPSPNIDEIEIFRDCSQPAGSGDLLTVLSRDGTETFRGSVASFRDPEPVFDRPCRYRVRLRNDQGHQSALSQPVTTQPEVAAAPPTGLHATVKEDRILLEWEPPQINSDGTRPARFVGYLVNGQHLVDDPRFEDFEFEFGKQETYRVQSVTRLEDPTILSQKSQPLRVVPKDVFAPPPPQNLSALPVTGEVHLFWDPSSAEDLKGFFVFRGTTPDELKKLTPLVQVNRHIDTPPFPGETLYYAVTAVDHEGNESRFSELSEVEPGD